MLVEAIVSFALLTLFTAVAYATMLASNRQAMTSRLYTLAQEMARNQIDLVLAAAPFNPQFSPPLGPQVPLVLTMDAARGGPAQETRALYVDPSTGQAIVDAELTTSIRDGGLPNTRAATVRVSYSFAGRNYEVVMNTLRTSDS